MKNSTIIIKSENNTVTYVIGQVMEKTADQVTEEIKELEAKRDGLICKDPETIKAEYEEKILLLQQELTVKLEQATKDKEEAEKLTAEINDRIDNLYAVLDSFESLKEPEIQEKPVEDAPIGEAL